MTLSEASKRRDEYKASNIALLENECRRNLMKEKKEREEGDDKQHQSINECLERLNKVQQHVSNVHIVVFVISSTFPFLHLPII